MEATAKVMFLEELTNVCCIFSVERFNDVSVDSSTDTRVGTLEPSNNELKITISRICL